MSTVVTGGAGFIGSHLVSRLLQSGREVVVADNMHRGSHQNLIDAGVDKSYPSVDLRRYDEALRILRGAETVFHLASYVGGVGYLHSGPMQELVSFREIALIDSNVFQACLANCVKKLVYTSSVSVYPMSKQVSSSCSLAEADTSPYDPEGGYGWGKLMGEIQVSWLSHAFPAGIIRFFNVYGINANLDETSHVVSALIRRAVLFPKEQFVVWGDGRQERGLLYVDDAVDALLACESRGCSNPPPVFNISSDSMITVRELANKIVAISGKPIVPVFDATKPTGAISRGADISRAKAILDWCPRTSLDDGLMKTYSWAERKLLK